MNNCRRVRTAFSLIEMVLSLALALLLLLALYLTLNTYTTSADLGRETLQEGELARSILTRIANDAANQLGAADTRSLPEYATAVQASGANVVYNVGIKGSATSLVLSVNRAEKRRTSADSSEPDTEVRSDLRRIHYWVVTNGGETVGLARREFRLATDSEIDTAPEESGDQEKYLLTKDKEIKSLTFEFHDGTSWVPSWSGDESVGEVGQRGPPAAIRVTLVLRPRAKIGQAAPETTGDSDQKLTFVHVIALPGGNNFSPPMTP